MVRINSFGDRSLLALFTLAFMSTSSQIQAQAQPKQVAVGTKGKRLKTMVENAGESLGFTGAVLVADEGKVILATATGFRDEEASQPVTTTTLFEIASASKPFTAVAICRLVESGKLSLSDSIAKHLPGVPDNCKSITVQHLLQHTSGIPGTNSQGAGEDLAKVLPMFLRGGPVSKPGTKWEYWNQGYSLLSEIVARASGMSYVDFCRQEIFKPAKMKSTCFTGDSKPDGIEVATGTSARGAPRTALEHPYGAYGFQYRGMGGIVTNLPDLWKFDRALRKNRLLKPETKATMFTPGLKGYGLGWYVGSRDDHSYQMHSGSVRGFLSDIRRYPDDDAMLVVLCNSDAAPMHMVSTALEGVLLNKKGAAAIPGGLTESLQDRLEGRYVNARNQPLIVEKAGDVMKARIEWGGPVTYAFLGAEKGKVIFFDGTWNELKLNTKGGKQVQSIEMGRSTFVRSG